MPLSVLGISHKTAPVDVREKIAFEPAALVDSLQQLQHHVSLDEVAVLSTCNRVEFYFKGEGDALERLKQWLLEHHHLESDSLAKCLYEKNASQALTHIMRVACGLDSMVVGEPQILGQMKDAFHSARHAGTTGSVLDKLFQHTFSVAKKVRTDTSIGQSAVSVAYAAVTLAKNIFTDLSQSKALFLGAGETIELAARHLHNQGVREMIVANRTLTRAEELTQQFGGHAITLNQLSEWIHEADIVISSTASPLPIVGKGLIEESIRKRKRKPMFMVDLAVPRDIESAVADLNDVYLYTVDDLQQVIDQNLQARSEAAQEAEVIIASQAEHFKHWLDSLSSVDLVRQYREQTNQLKDQEVERALLQLSSGESPEKVLEQFAHRLTNKIMHHPTQYLRALKSDDAVKANHEARLILGIDASQDNTMDD